MSSIIMRDMLGIDLPDVLRETYLGLLVGGISGYSFKGSLGAFAGGAISGAAGLIIGAKTAREINLDSLDFSFFSLFMYQMGTLFWGISESNLELYCSSISSGFSCYAYSLTESMVAVSLSISLLFLYNKIFIS